MLLAALLRSGRGPRPLTFLAAILVFSGIFAMLRSRIPTQIDLSETNAICEEGYEEWCDTEMGGGSARRTGAGVEGGFKGSSQHLREELRCLRRSADARIELYVRGCGHPAGRGWDGGSIGGGSGRKSLEVCRARRRPWRWVCHPLSEHAGFANVAACHLSNCIHCRGVIYRSSSEKRSPFFEPAVVVCARSLGSLAAHPRRSLESCGATQPRVVGTSNIGPRPRSGTPSDERNVLRLPSSL